MHTHPPTRLQGSKSIAKRRAEVEQAEKQDRDAKRLRMEMKQRGHVVSAGAALGRARGACTLCHRGAMLCRCA